MPSDFYDLTRKLVARGCPEHPRLRRSVRADSPCEWWLYEDNSNYCGSVGNADDARDLWTMHVLRWAQGFVDARLTTALLSMIACAPRERVWVARIDSYDGSGPAILEAIEAATRHLEPARKS